MTRAELRRELRRKKSELRAQLARARRAARGRVDGIDLVRRARRRKRVKQAVGLTILVALLLMLRCDCGRAQLGVQGAPSLVADSGAKLAPASVPPPTAMEARIARQPRAVFTAKAQEAAGWLDEFRLQVAARSPRLARCFVGVERPGALRWSVALNPSSGAVFDHQIELVGAEPGIEERQRVCVEQVLSNPAYALEAAPDDAFARRVSLVIEF